MPVNNKEIIPLPPPLPAPDTTSSSFENKKKDNEMNNFSTKNKNQKKNFNEPLPIVGLVNLGNTCYMNAVLQCLARTKNLLHKLNTYGSGTPIKLQLTPNPIGLKIVTKGMNSLDIAETEEEKENEEMLSETSDLDQNEMSNTTLCNGDDEQGSDDGSEKNDDKEIESILKPAEGEAVNLSYLELKLKLDENTMVSHLNYAFKRLSREEKDAVNDNESRYNYHSSIGSFRPSAVHRIMQEYFRIGLQHDSHEFLRTLLDTLKKEHIKAFRIALMSHYGIKKHERSNPNVNLVKTWDKKFFHKTFVDEVFGGQLVSVQTCLNCKSVRYSYEEFLDLSLPIQVSKSKQGKGGKYNNSSYLYGEDLYTNTTLEECLTAFTKEEVLDEANVVECQECHKVNLEKLESGVPFEKIFPGLAAKALKNEENVQNKQGGSGNKKREPGANKKKEKRKNKREIRQEKKNNRNNKNKLGGDQNNVENNNENEIKDNSEGGERSCTSNLNIVENHFNNHHHHIPRPTLTANNKATTCDEKSSNQSGSGGSLDDYVVVNKDLSPGSFNYDSNNSKSKNFEYNNNNKDNEETPEEDYHDTREMDSSTQFEVIEEGTTGCLLPSSGKDLLYSEDLELEDYGNQSPITIDDPISPNSADDDIDDEDLNEPAADGVVGDISGDEDEFGDCINNEDNKEDLKLNFMTTDSNTILASDLLVKDEKDDDDIDIDGGNNADVEDEDDQEYPRLIDDGFSSSISSSIKSSGTTSPNPTQSSDSGVGPNEKIPMTKCPCSRRQMIFHAPNFLTVHLKRFQISNRGYTSKIGNHVEFSHFLDLTKFCESANYDEDGQVIYSLYGFVEHGGSINWGHYVAYVRDNDKWYYISDSTGHFVQREKILSMNPYILFYEKVTGKEKHELLERSRQNLSLQAQTSSSSKFDNNEYEPSYVEENWDSPPQIGMLSSAPFPVDNWDYDGKTNSSNENENKEDKEPTPSTSNLEDLKGFVLPNENQSANETEDVTLPQSQSQETQSENQDERETENHNNNYFSSFTNNN